MERSAGMLMLHIWADSHHSDFHHFLAIVPLFKLFFFFTLYKYKFFCKVFQCSMYIDEFVHTVSATINFNSEDCYCWAPC